jgi:hypothetical protein
LQHVSTHMSNHYANLEQINVFEFLLTVLFVSKAADPCVSSGWPCVLVQLSLRAGVNKFSQLSFIQADCLQGTQAPYRGNMLQ